MINYNGDLLPLKSINISNKNRGFKYGDAIFETIKVVNNRIVFFEDHYFRLMASMRMLRMKIPMLFTLEFLEQEVLKTINGQKENNFSFRVRLTVFRKDGGLYNPKTNEVDFLIEATENNYVTKSVYKVDLYKDFYNFSGLLSTIKTNNRILNTLASIYASENDYDNCILINEKKRVVEVTNGNIFIVKNNIIKTPSLEEGCIKGIVRKKVLNILENHPDFLVEETIISPFDVQKADEVFITNAIVGIQPVTNYRKKEFATDISTKLQSSLKVKEMTG